jgi:hypothetical protein
VLKKQKAYGDPQNTEKFGRPTGSVHHNQIRQTFISLCQLARYGSRPASVRTLPPPLTFVSVYETLRHQFGLERQGGQNGD